MSFQTQAINEKQIAFSGICCLLFRRVPESDIFFLLFPFKSFITNKPVCFFSSLSCQRTIAANNYLLKVNNKNTRKKCEICLKLTIKTLERPCLHCSGVFIVNFDHNSYLFLVY